jgi:hypothetical protein
MNCQQIMKLILIMYGQIQVRFVINYEICTFNSDLFADGNDFSWETIRKGRNTYYQKQIALQIDDQQSTTISLLTSVLNIDLNIDQNFTIDTRAVFMFIEKILFGSLLNKYILSNQIYIPSKVNSTLKNNDIILFRVSSISSKDLLTYYFPVNNTTTCSIWKFQFSAIYKSFQMYFTFSS